MELSYFEFFANLSVFYGVDVYKLQEAYVLDKQQHLSEYAFKNWINKNNLNLQNANEFNDQIDEIRKRKFEEMERRTRSCNYPYYTIYVTQNRLDLQVDNPLKGERPLNNKKPKKISKSSRKNCTWWRPEECTIVQNALGECITAKKNFLTCAEAWRYLWKKIGKQLPLRTENALISHASSGKSCKTKKLCSSVFERFREYVNN